MTKDHKYSARTDQGLQALELGELVSGRDFLSEGGLRRS